MTGIRSDRGIDQISKMLQRAMGGKDVGVKIIQAPHEPATNSDPANGEEIVVRGCPIAHVQDHSGTQYLHLDLQKRRKSAATSTLIGIVVGQKSINAIRGPACTVQAREMTITSPTKWIPFISPIVESAVPPVQPRHFAAVFAAVCSAMSTATLVWRSSAKMFPLATSRTLISTRDLQE